jgi:hypothetical protein
VRIVSARQDLQRDEAVELHIAREIHLTHSARAEGRLNLVTANARSGGEGHGRNE